jgi:hypothetical protein
MEDIKAQFNQFSAKVSQQLAERCAELDRRAEALDRREAELDKREREMNERIAGTEQVLHDTADKSAVPTPVVQPRLFDSGNNASKSSLFSDATPKSTATKSSSLFGGSGAMTACTSTDAKPSLFGSSSVAAQGVSKEDGLSDSGVGNRGLYQAPTPARASPTAVGTAQHSTTEEKADEAAVDTNRLRQLFEKKNQPGKGEATLTRRKTWTPVMRDVPVPSTSSSVAATPPPTSTTASAEEQRMPTVKVNARMGDGGTAYRPKTVLNKPPPQRRSLQELLSADDAKAKAGI